MPWIENREEKRETILRILHALPDWFGVPESIIEYGEKGMDLPCYVHEEDEKAVAFVVFKQTSECAGEVYVTGVLPEYHRRGIGRELVEVCEQRCRDLGLPLLHVKTLSDAVGHGPYLKTYAFYRAMGFLPLEVLPLWDERNPCLLLVKPLS